MRDLQVLVEYNVRNLEVLETRIENVFPCFVIINEYDVDMVDIYIKCREDDAKAIMDILKTLI